MTNSLATSYLLINGIENQVLVRLTKVAQIADRAFAHYKLEHPNLNALRPTLLLQVQDLRKIG